MPHFSRTLLTLSVLSSLSALAHAQQQDTAITSLDTITVHAQAQEPSDGVVEQIQHDQLQQAATTLGEALGSQAGISAASFGTGASRPIIRGQDGARVKVTSNASDTMDVSSLSPDHVMTVDPQLAERIEVIRGPAALRYAAGAVGGVVNVIDQSIVTEMPDRDFQGDVNLRYNSGNDERLANAGVTLGLGDQFALRVEALRRDANNIIVPGYSVLEDHGDHQHQIKQRRVDNTFAQSDALNLGLSWIGDRGYAGIGYRLRKDQYGLPGHSHEYESCHLHDVSLHCGGHGAEDHEHAGDHGHDGHEGGHGDGHADGHEGHDHAGPWIDLKSERYEFKSQLNTPFQGVDALRFQSSYTDYAHDEIEEQQLATRFVSQAYDSRLEFDHTPIWDWAGTWGLQYSQQKLDLTGEEALMAPTKTQKYSLFALEKKQWERVEVELAGRIDQQRIDIQSEQANNDATAYSASAAAHWHLTDEYTVSASASHQQRLPLAQELYSDGKHFATNTYELGNSALTKEKSNNLELGFKFERDALRLGMQLYHNWFDDYIYAQTLDRYQDFRLIQYQQANAKFYGAEAQLDYQLSPIYSVALMGDYVRGRIEQENAPRVPAGRVGATVNAQFDANWQGSASLFHVFEQDKIAAYEQTTAGYQMLNLGLSYSGKIGTADQQSSPHNYKLYFNANNLLDSKVYQHSSFLSNVPQMGRNFVMGVQYKF